MSRKTAKSGVRILARKTSSLTKIMNLSLNIFFSGAKFVVNLFFSLIKITVTEILKAKCDTAVE